MKLLYALAVFFLLNGALGYVDRFYPVFFSVNFQRFFSPSRQTVAHAARMKSARME